MKSALFWRTTEAGKVQCELCPHHCVIAEKKTGLCGIRRVVDGGLMATGYGLISSLHNDPIEKKPLFHFHPGSAIFSIGGWGCNFACRFCQNWQISQAVNTQAQLFRPDEVVQAARDQNSPGIAYTYNEPLINYEFIQDCAQLARAAGLFNVLVTNGFVEEKPAAELLPLIDALNIDIKSMDASFYKQQCRGALAPVLRFARQAVAFGNHVEITNLLIPGLNDGEEQVGQVSAWMAANLGPLTPLHLSAYHPEYKMDLPSTPAAVLERAFARCKRDLAYVYMGNVMTSAGQNTFCPQCAQELIVRQGYATRIVGIVNHACRQCGRPADVVM
ncbi:MAG: AmmeMemoRadiSam system radical SAM enzyme [Verrucomicrobia bacterium]|nr:AmmeMemoRadiSam system radical SAM enzyme [Verrucomicrobiota bacterium]MBU1733865.1 AmmeMemoRadiSam system radical SAM enzyme [Verrucomicrobiota bacterium]MBU1856309.1 AmmeMemoRadiSam system radical SAM enzyme [Verrucomicrobiota bacterium]